MFSRFMSCLAFTAALVAALVLRVEPGVAAVEPATSTMVPASAGALLAEEPAQQSRDANLQVAQYRRGRGLRRNPYHNGRRYYRGRGYGHRRAYRGGYKRGRGYRRYGRSYGYYGGINPGAAAAAGIIGLTAGVIAGSALAAPYGTRTVVIPNSGSPAPYSGEWYRRCDLKYRSFRASDGTFLGYDGIRRVCRLP